MKTVLVVDDEPRIVDLARDYLEHAGFAVLTAADGPSALRRYMIENFVVEGFTFEQVMSDDEALEAFVRKATIGVWHASCTCRMGLPDDPMSVVDTQGRVKGVQGLRVVDASVFPVVPCANTNFPTLMTAEKIADAMTRDAMRGAA